MRKRNIVMITIVLIVLLMAVNVVLLSPILKPYLLYLDANFINKYQSDKNSISLYSELIRNYPGFIKSHPDVYYKVGLNYYHSKDYYQGARYFEEYLKMTNDIGDEQKLLIGDAFINTENYYQGKKYLDKIIDPEKLTNESIYYIGRAILEKQQKNYDKAIEYADKVLNNEKEQNDLIINKARLIKVISLLQKEDAKVVVEIKKLSSSSFLNVDFYLVSNYLFLLSKISPNFDQMVLIYTERPKPLDNAFFYTSFGMIYREAGEIEKAKVYYKKAITQYPAFVPIYLDIERIYTAQGDFKVALEYFKKAARIYPTYFRTNNGIGWSYYELIKSGRLDKQYYDVAMEHLRLVNEVNPEYSRAYNTIGVIYFEKKDYQKAIEFFNKALKYEDYAKPYGNLGDVYEALGDMKKAKEYRDKSFKAPNN